jgi:hypothetical protein
VSAQQFFLSSGDDLAFATLMRRGRKSRLAKMTVGHGKTAISRLDQLEFALAELAVFKKKKTQLRFLGN